MTDNTVTQPDLSEGVRAAKKIERGNLIAKFIWILLMLIYFAGIIYSLSNDIYFLYFLCLIAAVITSTLTRIFYSRIHLILSSECDPYKAEEAYAYFYEKQRNKGRQRACRNTLLAIVQCIIMQGDYDRAFSVLTQMNPSLLKKNHLASYYDSLRMYYCEKHDVTKTEDMKRLFGKLSRNASLSRRIRKTMLREIEMIDLSASLQAGDLSVYHVLSAREDWKKARGLTKISERWTDARAHKLQGDYEAARIDCYYVIANGNRLYYAEKAKKLLEELNA